MLARPQVHPALGVRHRCSADENSGTGRRPSLQLAYLARYMYFCQCYAGAQRKSPTKGKRARFEEELKVSMILCCLNCATVRR